MRQHPKASSPASSVIAVLSVLGAMGALYLPLFLG